MQAQSWWYVSDLIRSSCIPQSLSGRVTTALCSITTQVLYRFTYTSLDQIHTFSPLLWLFLGLNYDINFFFVLPLPSLSATPSPSGNPILFIIIFFLLIFFLTLSATFKMTRHYFFFSFSPFLGAEMSKRIFSREVFFFCMFICVFLYFHGLQTSITSSLILSISLSVRVLYVGGLVDFPTHNKQTQEPSSSELKRCGGKEYFYINREREREKSCAIWNASL